MVGEELDEQVREYIKELRKLGVIINAHVVIAVGMGLVLNRCQLTRGKWWPY